jgi:hypothetical protein
MAWTKASAATSISSRTRSHRLMHEPQFAKDPEFGMGIDMEEATTDGPDPKGSEAQ